MPIVDLLAFAKNIADRVERQASRVQVPVAFCVFDIHGNVALEKDGHVTVFLVSPRGSRSRRHSDRKPRATRALARMSRGEKASGRRAMRDAVDSARRLGEKVDRRYSRPRKFPPCKALKTHKMRK
jgi:hypothetical protein